MPRPNRVNPFGEREAVEARGMFWGNRGALHNDDGEIVRYSRGKGWVTCELDYKQRRRNLLAPGRLTELFFLDEATALAAGHRPCGKCRPDAYRRFKEAWNKAHGGPPISATEMDEVLHRDRLARPGSDEPSRPRLTNYQPGPLLSSMARSGCCGTTGSCSGRRRDTNSAVVNWTQQRYACLRRKPAWTSFARAMSRSFTRARPGLARRRTERRPRKRRYFVCGGES